MVLASRALPGHAREGQEAAIRSSADGRGRPYSKKSPPDPVRRTGGRQNDALDSPRAYAVMNWEVLLAGPEVHAGLVHLYQGPRGAVIVAPLSVLFVLSGSNLWTVILCHGLYDTVAFVRFARGKSKYSGPKSS